MTNLSLLKSTSCRVGASVLDAAEDLEDGEDVHTGPSLRPQSRTSRLVEDVVVEVTEPAEAPVYNILIVSLLAPKTDIDGELGYPTNRIDLDMANSPR